MQKFIYDVDLILIQKGLTFQKMIKKQQASWGVQGKSEQRLCETINTKFEGIHVQKGKKRPRPWEGRIGSLLRLQDSRPLWGHTYTVVFYETWESFSSVQMDFKSVEIEKVIQKSI